MSSHGRRKGAKEFSGLPLIRTFTSLTRTPALWPNYLPKVPDPNTITVVRGGISIYKFRGGGTNIESITYYGFSLAFTEYFLLNRLNMCGNREGWAGGLQRRFRSEGMYVYVWLIHVVVQQKPIQYCKTIILQFKIKKRRKKWTRPSEVDLKGDDALQRLVLLGHILLTKSVCDFQKPLPLTYYRRINTQLHMQSHNHTPTHTHTVSVFFEWEIVFEGWGISLLF